MAVYVGKSNNIFTAELLLIGNVSLIISGNSNFPLNNLLYFPQRSVKEFWV